MQNMLQHNVSPVFVATQAGLADTCSRPVHSNTWVAAVCECQTLHATRAAIKIEYGLGMTYSSGDSNIKKHCATVGA